MTVHALSEVWCVFRDYAYEGDQLHAVFSTEALAEAFIAGKLARTHTKRDDWYVEMYVIDRCVPRVSGES